MVYTFSSCPLRAVFLLMSMELDKSTWGGPRLTPPPPPRMSGESLALVPTAGEVQLNQCSHRHLAEA